MARTRRIISADSHLEIPPERWLLRCSLHLSVLAQICGAV